MKKNILFAIALSALVLGSAKAQDVRYNFDKDTDFSKFKTYKWVTLKDSTKPNELIDKPINHKYRRGIIT